VDGGTRDEDGFPFHDPGSVSYNAAVERRPAATPTHGPPAVAQRAHREARRRGFDAAPDASSSATASSGSGIWLGEQFPRAIEVVDLDHAKGHLSDR